MNDLFTDQELLAKLRDRPRPTCPEDGAFLNRNGRCCICGDKEEKEEQ